MVKTLQVNDETHEMIKSFCSLHIENATLGDFVNKICNGTIKQQTFLEFVEIQKKFYKK